KINTNRSGNDPLELTVNGSVVSDISVLGPRDLFLPLQNVITFGLVRQKEGAEVKLILITKGPHRDEVEFSVAHVEPSDVLEATLANKDAAASGAAVRQSLVVRIPPGAR